MDEARAQSIRKRLVALTSVFVIVFAADLFRRGWDTVGDFFFAFLTALAAYIALAVLFEVLRRRYGEEIAERFDRLTVFAAAALMAAGGIGFLLYLSFTNGLRGLQMAIVFVIPAAILFFGLGGPAWVSRRLGSSDKDI